MMKISMRAYSYNVMMRTFNIYHKNGYNTFAKDW